MKVTDFTGLKNVGEVAKGLEVLLADLQVYYTNLRNFHWNVKGRQFYRLHTMFEEMYDDVAEKIDEVAERLLMLDVTPEHKFSEYLKVAEVAETPVLSDGDAAVKNILDTMKVIIARERAILEAAGEISDEATAAMMSDYISEQEKSVWLMSAYLG